MHSFRSARNKYSKIMDINEHGFFKKYFTFMRGRHDIDAIPKKKLSLFSRNRVLSRSQNEGEGCSAFKFSNLFPTLMSKVSSCTCIYLFVIFVPLMTFSLIWTRHYIGEGLQS